MLSVASYSTQLWKNSCELCGVGHIGYVYEFILWTGPGHILGNFLFLFFYKPYYGWQKKTWLTPGSTQFTPIFLKLGSLDKINFDISVVNVCEHEETHEETVKIHIYFLYLLLSRKRKKKIQTRIERSVFVTRWHEN